MGGGPAWRLDSSLSPLDLVPKVALGTRSLKLCFLLSTMRDSWLARGKQRFEDHAPKLSFGTRLTAHSLFGSEHDL